MPRLFLHLRNGSSVIEDPEGQDFERPIHARAAAIRGAREIMAARILRGEEPDGSEFLIVDEAGRTILIVPFEEAIRRRR